MLKPNNRNVVLFKHRCRTCTVDHIGFHPQCLWLNTLGVLNPGARGSSALGEHSRSPFIRQRPPALTALEGFEMNHHAQPFTSRWGNCNIDPAALDAAALSDSVICQRLPAWEEHRVHIDLFSVGAESLEMEICGGN